MEKTPAHRLSLSGVLSESERILIANYSHFIAISLLFLPLSFSLITSPIFQLPGQLFTVDQFHKFPPINIFYILIVYILSLCAIATITYSTYHGFFGKRVNFFTAIKSLTSSFFPIVSTVLVSHVLVLFVSLSFLLLVGTNVLLVQNLGFIIDYNSIYFMWFSVVIGACLTILLIYFHVNWSLAFVVVVAESKSGLAALKRSSYLVKGMRSVSLLLCLYFGFFFGISVWVMRESLQAFSNWTYVLFAMMVGLGLLMSYLRHGTAANTVLYNYCKAFHGELAIEGFGHEYISLPSDAEKVPHVVIA